MNQDNVKKAAKGVGIGIGVVLVVAVLGIAGAFIFLMNSGKSVGKNVSFAEFEMTSLDQQSTMTQEDIKDHKLTVINLWQTTCSGCINEMPDLEELSKEYEGQVQFVGICTDPVEKGGMDQTLLEQAQSIVAACSVTYPQMLPSKQVTEIMGDIYAYPVSFLVDSQGRVLDSISGSRSKDAWNKIIAENLAKTE